MRSLINWNPFEELEELDMRMNRLFNDSLRLQAPATGSVNIYEEDKNLKIEAILPDFNDDEVSVDVADDKLTIRAERSQEREKKTKKYHRREYVAESFYRVIALPKGVDADHAQAIHKNGVLTVTLPMKALPEPKRIAIESADGKSRKAEQKK